MWSPLLLLRVLEILSRHIVSGTPDGSQLYLEKTWAWVQGSGLEGDVLLCVALYLVLKGRYILFVGCGSHKHINPALLTVSFRCSVLLLLELF